MNNKYYTYFDIKWGRILSLENEGELSGLYFIGQKYYPQIDTSRQQADTDTGEMVRKQVQEYIAGGRKQFDIPYKFCTGTPFQQKVWQAVATIPYGQAISYKELAFGLHMPNSIRAVATAVARNPLLLIIPCHRVIGSNGKLTGYAAGLDLKKHLLDLEKQYYN